MAAPAYEQAIAGLMEVFEGKIVSKEIRVDRKRQRLVRRLFAGRPSSALSYRSTTQQAVPPLYEFDKDTQVSLAGRFFDKMFADYSSFAKSRPDSPKADHTQATLKRVAGTLRSSEHLFFSIRGRVLEHLLENPDFNWDRHSDRLRNMGVGKKNGQNEDDLFQSIIDGSLPIVTFTRNSTRQTKNVWQLPEQPATEADPNPFYVQHAAALQKGDYTSVPRHLFYPETRAGALRAIALIEEAVAYIRAESKPGGRYEKNADLAISGITQTLSWLQRRANSVKYEAPWKEKVALLPSLSWADKRWYVEPMIRNDRLFVFEIDEQNKSVRLLGVNLEDRLVFEGKSVQLVASGMEDNTEKSWSNTSRFRRFYTGFVDGKNVYLGTAGFGIIVFPLDLSEPWRITMNDGLPSNVVQGLGAINGVLYAGLGEYTGTSYLVRVEVSRDPLEKRVEVLSATIEEDGKAPFFNLPARTRFHPFLLDEKRNRLLFSVQISTWPTPRTDGIWSVDGETGLFTQIPDLFGRTEKMELLPDGDTLLIGDSWRTGTLDLRNDCYTLVSASLSSDETDAPAVWGKRMIPTLGRKHHFDLMTIADGWAWGLRRESSVQCFWARAKLDDPDQWSLLELPDGMDTEKDGWFPEYDIIVHPDGKGVIACDKHRIVLFHW